MHFIPENGTTNSSEAAEVLGTSAEYNVSEVADRNAGIVLKINKELLQPLTRNTK